MQRESKTDGGVANNGILPKMWYPPRAQEIQDRQSSILNARLPQMRIQKAGVSQESRTQNRQSHSAYPTAVRSRNRQGRTKTPNPSNRSNRVPQMRKQHRLRLAGADERR